MNSDRFLRAALIALDEIGDPTDARGVVEAALAKPPPLQAHPAPQSTLKRIGWHAAKLAMYAKEPARAYAELHALCTALFDPIPGSARPAAPAPEVALTMSPAALVDALSPSPRVATRELAIAAALDTEFLLEDPRPERRILGVRSVPTRRLARYAHALAERIALDPDPAVRTEAIAVADGAREAVAEPLALHAEHADPAIRLAAIEGLRALKIPLADKRLVARLADEDPRVRAAAARSVVPASVVGDALVVRLADDDPDVRTAALDAVTRVPALHHVSLVPILVALLRVHRGDLRNAIYLLGKLPSPESFRALAACIVGERSDLAHAATLVLGQLKIPVPEVPVETRLLRAARELAAADRDAQLAGTFEAKRLGPEAARPLLPALRRLGEALARAGDPMLVHVRETLADLGVPEVELPRARIVLAPWQGIVPRERDRHGAYVIAIAEVPATRDREARSVPGLWDAATGALLFVVDGAELFEILHGRAEVGVVRAGDMWSFERYAVPSGKQLARMEIPEDLAVGWPAKLANASTIVTVFCDDDEPYRFHIKLGRREDHVLDDEPNRTPKLKRRGSLKLPRRKAK